MTDERNKAFFKEMLQDHFEDGSPVWMNDEEVEEYRKKLEDRIDEIRTEMAKAILDEVKQSWEDNE